MIIRGRNIWMVFHRWVGIVLGVVIAVLGITGAALVFEHDIDTALYPKLLSVEPAGTPLPFDDIVKAAADAHPGWSPRYFQRRSDSPTESFKVVLADSAKAEKQVFVNPYTAEVLGERSGLSPIALVRRIHGELVLGNTGEIIVGVLSFLCVAFFAAGAVLWWPAKGGFKRALMLRTSSEPKRLMRELHNVFGAWLLVFFMIAAVTVPPLVWMGSGEAPPPPAGAGPPRGERPTGPPPELTAPPQPLTWQTAADFAAAEAPGQYVGFILRNEGPRGIFMVRFWPAGTTGPEKQSNVIMPITGGRILRVQRPAPFTLASIYKTEFAANVHSGAILGLPGRMIMFIAGLGLPVLFVTGLVMWVLGRRRTAI